MDNQSNHVGICYPVFYGAHNLVEKAVAPVEPWTFQPTVEQLDYFRSLKKPTRRQELKEPGTSWQVYSAVGGLNPGLRVSNSNRAAVVNGLVVDYDARTTVQEASRFLEELPPSLHPNYIEISLSLKVRLVWRFARSLLVMGDNHAEALLCAFFDRLKAPILLPGYDKASERAYEVWTNGGEWHNVRREPLSWDFILGVACEVSKKSSLFGREEIPLDVIAERVSALFPGRWQGEFKLGALGVRFWDPNADCQTGCQVKPDGMLCFTGTQSFVRWEQIFTTVWCDQQRALNLGKAADGILFDGRQYWRKIQHVWQPMMRPDVTLLFQTKGLSDRVTTGRTVSDCGRVLAFIQEQNRIFGAAPLINYPPGLVNVNGRRILNTANLTFPTLPEDGSGDPSIDCPFIWTFLKGFFAAPDRHPLEHFLAWLQRAARAARDYERLMGQAIFICGPVHNGKTLLIDRIAAPILGGRIANPYDFLTGATPFNNDLFESYLLAINDEESPRTEAERRTFLARLKGMVVNPHHTYHPKFRDRIAIEWTGRIAITLNDDPGSVGMLPEVNVSTRDKMSFFRSQAYQGTWPESKIVEANILRELPYFTKFLLSWSAPHEVLEASRCGCKSYYDTDILRLSQEQAGSYNLLELLKTWVNTSVFWTENGEWKGSPTDLLGFLKDTGTTAGVIKGWTQKRIADAMTMLAKMPDTGIEFLSPGHSRDFRITKTGILNQARLGDNGEESKLL